MRWLTRPDIPEHTGDFYLLDRKVVDVLNAMEERNPFVRGLVMWTGFKRMGVPYKREARFAGRSKFSLGARLKFCFESMTAFSLTPLRGILIVGGAMSLVSFLGILIVIYQKLFTDNAIVGWTSLMTVILFIGGLQLLALGIIGEYVAHIAGDVRKRPQYTVQEML